MNAKVIDFYAYKKKKKEKSLSVFEISAIALNMLVVLSIGIGFIWLIHRPTGMEWFANAVSLLLLLFMGYHAVKMINVFKNRQAIEKLSYITKPIVMLVIMSGVLSLFTFGLLLPFEERLKYFLILQMFCFPNVLLLIKLSKKGEVW